MTWILLIALIGFLIWQTVIILKHKTAIKGFELLLTRFIEVNQEFYECQKNIAKKEKEVFENLVKQTSEISIVRKYVNQLNLSNRNISETVKSLKEIQKNVKDSSDELVVSKDIATSLANVSNNIRLLDKIVNNLRASIDKLKRGK